MNSCLQAINTIIVLICLAVFQPVYAITIDTVPIDHPNNSADTRYGTFGSVEYSYRVGKTEVTNAQYAAFLNAVAASDPYELYNPGMRIVQNGQIDHFTYTVRSPETGHGPGGTNYTYGDKPVVYVSWCDAVRFTNWLNNGQGGPGTTEDGAYTLLGGTPVPSNADSITRNPGARWFLPTENEWYKAAYYDPVAGIYYDYPTGTNSVPNNNPPNVDTGNSANFVSPNGMCATGDCFFPLTGAGAYTKSDSPYGTFDQGGNVIEWNETVAEPFRRGIRGGGWRFVSDILRPIYGGGVNPAGADSVVGFRVASVIPEPSTILLLVCGTVGAFVARKRFARTRWLVTAAFIASLGVAPPSAHAVTIDMITVGNPGNAPDTRYNSMSVGSVGYVYQIGKYEITAGQYTEFLNAVAKADPNELYNTAMGGQAFGQLGANIQRTGSSPNFSYSVAADWANRPVNYVNFWDAARFANWLHNGQPTGAQGPGTTEGGAYHDVGNQTLFGRNPAARFFIPTEDEWYKAAYHDKTAGMAASYFNYPTGSNTAPINTIPDPGNHANFYDNHYLNGNLSYSIGSPYYRTEVGAFVNSASPYGTFDQGGNVSEWNETVLSACCGSYRGLRGGSWGFNVLALLASQWPVDSDLRDELNTVVSEWQVL